MKRKLIVDLCKKKGHAGCYMDTYYRRSKSGVETSQLKARCIVCNAWLKTKEEDAA